MQYFLIKKAIFTVELCSVTGILTFWLSFLIIIASSMNDCILKFNRISVGSALIVLRVIKVDFQSSLTFLLMKLMHLDFGIKVSWWHSISTYCKLMHCRCPLNSIHSLREVLPIPALLMSKHNVLCLLMKVRPF